jgi:hypothetical protein
MPTIAEDCGALVGDQPTCADPSWTLYYDAYAFCCTGNQVGIQGGEQCQPKSLTFSEGLYAATVSIFFSRPCIPTLRRFFHRL